MENNNERKQSLGEMEGNYPVLLGRRFRLQGLDGVYVVLGIKGRLHALVLEEESSGEIRNMSNAEFMAIASRADT